MLTTEVKEALDKVLGENVFITCEPENLDFTSDKRIPNIILMAKGGLRFEIPVDQDQKAFLELIAGLNYYLCTKKKLVIGWNIKSFLTYVRYRTGQDWEFNGPMIDLKVLESFCGIHNDPPKNFKDAFTRANEIIKGESWGQVGQIYQMVYLPLITKIIPHIETTGLNDSRRKHPVYSCYEVEGQVNGRMKCNNAFLYSFNPHTLDDETKGILRPTEYDADFLYFDYKNMEVSMLQWLSKDPALGEILESGEDVYKIIWERITNVQCTDALRAACKATFLPVVYGQGAKAVAERLKLSQSVAERLVSQIYGKFPVAMAWIQTQQANLKDNTACDYFGRRRRFDDQQYKVRNFVVQAPAAVVCLHKLIRLYEAVQGSARIVYHVHDGYGIITEKKNTSVCKLAVETLESPEDLYPGLKLRVTASRGQHLSQLKRVEVK